MQVVQFSYSTPKLTMHQSTMVKPLAKHTSRTYPIHFPDNDAVYFLHLRHAVLLQAALLLAHVATAPSYLRIRLPAVIVDPLDQLLQGAGQRCCGSSPPRAHTSVAARPCSEPCAADRLTPSGLYRHRIG